MYFQIYQTILSFIVLESHALSMYYNILIFNNDILWTFWSMYYCITYTRLRHYDIKTTCYKIKKKNVTFINDCHHFNFDSDRTFFNIDYICRLVEWHVSKLDPYQILIEKSDFLYFSDPTHVEFRLRKNKYRCQCQGNRGSTMWFEGQRKSVFFLS